MKKVLYMLGEFTDQDVDWLISAGRRQHVTEGTTLIQQGEPIEEVFFVLRGLFGVSIDGSVEIAQIGSGEIVGGPAIDSQSDLLDVLGQVGFRTPQHTWRCSSVDEVLDAIDELDRVRGGFDYDTDGAVIKLNSFFQRDRIGATAKAPRWAMAYKYAPEQAQTRLNAITVQVGRTGTLTPVAELEPVFLDGSTISRATLHNEEEISRKDIRVGDTVIIEKRGDVIPGLIGVVKEERPAGAEPFDMQSATGNQCPECDGEIRKDESFVAWRCINTRCPAQAAQRLEHFAARTALDIYCLSLIHI